MGTTFSCRYSQWHGPLQDLKVIMDRLELLQSQYPSVPLDPILEQLETLGIHLRQ